MHTNYIQLPPDSTGKKIQVQRVLLLTVDSIAQVHKGDVLTTSVTGNQLKVAEAVIVGGVNMIHAMFMNIAQETANPVQNGELLSKDGVTVATIILTPDYSFFNATSLVSADNPYHGQVVDAKGQAFVRYADGAPQFDSFGRNIVSRVQAKYTLEFSCGCPPRGVYYWLAGGGTHEIEPLGAMVLRTTTAADSRVTMQTNEHFRYTPGFSTSYVFTMACADSGKDNVVRRIGAFDDLDGLFYQIGANGLSVGIKNSINATERLVAQADFNGDRVDGTGISGYTVDLTKDNIYWIDFQWLGAGAVSFGMFINGEKIVLHREGHFNQLSHSYMRSGSRPFRVEQYNTGLAGSSSEFRFFCLSVISDESSKAVNFDRTAPITISQTYSTNEPTVMFTVRPKQFNVAGAVNRRKVGIPEAMISGVSDDNKGVFVVQLVANATVTGGTWNEVTGASEYSTDATVTGGVVVNQRIIKTAGDVMILQRGPDAPTIKRKADPAESETLTLVFKRLRGAQAIDVDASFIIADGV